mmetsp:Transcript_23348/g.63074  ORF Transcript_23348/g.63074 Transcript_23348/m.63074 type:complete len:84 (-) Transcript_23348:12-263(-)
MVPENKRRIGGIKSVFNCFHGFPKQLEFLSQLCEITGFGHLLRNRPTDNSRFIANTAASDCPCNLDSRYFWFIRTVLMKWFCM